MKIFNVAVLNNRIILPKLPDNFIYIYRHCFENPKTPLVNAMFKLTDIDIGKLTINSCSYIIISPNERISTVYTNNYAIPVFTYKEI